MKTVLITGGASGIGEMIARSFANEKYNIAINYNKSKTQAESIKKEFLSFGINSEIYQCDVTNKCAVKDMVNQVIARFKSIDVLVVNAGVALFKQFQDCTEDDFDTVFNTNVKGAFNVASCVSEIMINQKCGKIIFISSIFGKTGASCEVLYSASKGAINTMTKALAKELGASNINVNAVLPGIINTKMNDRLSQNEMQDFTSTLCLNKIGTIQDVSNAVIFLASEKSDYITGQLICVDGGY